MGVSCKESVFTVSMWYLVFLECRRFLGPDKKSSPMILVMSFVEPGKLSQFYVYLQYFVEKDATLKTCSVFIASFDVNN